MKITPKFLENCDQFVQAAYCFQFYLQAIFEKSQR